MKTIEQRKKALLTEMFGEELADEILGRKETRKRVNNLFDQMTVGGDKAAVGVARENLIAVMKTLQNILDIMDAAAEEDSGKATSQKVHPRPASKVKVATRAANIMEDIASLFPGAKRRAKKANVSAADARAQGIQEDLEALFPMPELSAVKTEPLVDPFVEPFLKDIERRN